MKNMDETRTAMITGGTGFVCMNVAETLLDNGINVVLVARRPLKDDAMAALSGKAGQLFSCCADVLEEAALRAAMDAYGVTDVIHGAAITPSREMEMERPKEIMEINTLGLMNALNAARAASTRRFIYLGSISGYGRTCFESEVLIEGESMGDPRSLYELSKFTGERIVQRYRDLFNMDAVVARVGDVFGPWERKTGVRSYMSFPYQLTDAARRGSLAILPDPVCIDWVYGRDIGASVYALLCAQALQYDIYPLCSGYLWPLTAWCERLAARFPAFSWRMAGPEDAPTIKVNQSKNNAPMQLTRLLADTGYQPYFDMERAFADYMRWIDAHPGYLE